MQAEDPVSDNASDYLAGLTEEEQIELAIRRSLSDQGSKLEGE